ncbi:YcnI family protein [Microbacterium sp. G2-8]|uniref:YcnI family copper-binding membrane protein n=1 Tax=Microbacterium sp. G2-8 TaxID=2842454 RepID=UPI001C8B07D3|nr:YcnI family protein [Microbacterium sp. G2-8]
MTTRTKKGALALTGTAIAAGLILAPTAAQAHVGIEADEAVPGAETTLTFGFNHGCDDSPTTALEVTMPDGLTGVHPVATSGWTIDLARDDESGRVSTVTFTADEAIPADLRGEAEMLVGIADDAEQTLAFPVEQVCAEGSVSWSEIAEDGQDPHELDSPAPVLTLTDPAPAQADEGADPLAIAVGAGAATLALAALGVAVAAFRRRA